MDVYLPPEYAANPNRRFPVLYMQDGQNLFDRNAPRGGWDAEGAMARATDFVPPDMKAQVIAHTTLAGAGETVEVTFKVPAAGTYTYLCTFPGHFQAGMRGTLTVK